MDRARCALRMRPPRRKGRPFFLRCSAGLPRPKRSGCRSSRARVRAAACEAPAPAGAAGLRGGRSCARRLRRGRNGGLSVRRMLCPPTSARAHHAAGGVVRSCCARRAEMRTFCGGEPDDARRARYGGDAFPGSKQAPPPAPEKTKRPPRSSGKAFRNRTVGSI